MAKKRIVILGATGSLGQATLRALFHHSDRFEIVGLTCKNRFKQLQAIINKNTLKNISVYCENCQQNQGVNCIGSIEDLINISKPDIVINTIAGVDGLRPAIVAIEVGATLFMGNKEGLIAGGRHLMEVARKYGVQIVPLDSEHVALQILLKQLQERPKKAIITGSGGALRDVPDGKIKNVSIKDVLNHPVWPMGAKITVDSATLINKVFEVIEANILFDIPVDRFVVLQDRGAMIHAGVQANNGNFLFHKGDPDMERVIANQLGLSEWGNIFKSNEIPQRLTPIKTMDVVQVAGELMSMGEVAVAEFVGADEVLTMSFIREAIDFSGLMSYLYRVKALLDTGNCTDINDCLRAVHEGKRLASKICNLK